MPLFSRRVGAAAAVLLMMMSGVFIGTTGATPATPERRVTAEGSTTVRLITGDEIMVRPDGGMMVKPAPGRERITMTFSSVDGRTSVVPSDAAPLIKRGRVDQRLFDITALAGSDTGDGINLIVTDGDPNVARGVAGVQTTRELPVVNGVALRVPHGSLRDVWDKVVTAGDNGRLWLDGRAKPSLDRSVPRIGAPAAWHSGLDGRGVRVAVLDTGVDNKHPDLADRIVEQRDFTGEGLEDRIGHGTHVASTIAGTAAASAGRNRGVAPGASLLIGKVCDQRGCPESAVVEGIGWSGESGAKIINLSLGKDPGLEDEPEDPMTLAVRAVTRKHGSLVVAAAGNNGPTKGTVNSPASAPEALAVGAVDRSDAVAEFSSRGPVSGSTGVKPEVTAPGVGINAARSGTSPGTGPYTAMSGTSMASPHVAGAAALLAQRDPSLTPEGIKELLMSSAVVNPTAGVFDQGAGRIDVARALNQTLVSSGPVDLGKPLWPHHDDAPSTALITYRNTGLTPLTLTMTVTATDVSGRPAPSGMFLVPATEVTVPAGGTTVVPLTALTTVEAPDGLYTGRVTATAAGTSVSTAFVIDREVESYDVTLTGIGPEGGPAKLLPSVVDSRLGTVHGAITSGMSNLLRLPKGDYASIGLVDTEDSTAIVGRSRETIDRPMTLTFDHRHAAPARARVSDADAVDRLNMIQMRFATDAGNVFQGIATIGGGRGLSTGMTDGSRPDPSLTALVNLTKANERRGRAHCLAFAFPGGLPHGVDREVMDDDLARVTMELPRTDDPLEFATFGTHDPDQFSFGVTEDVKGRYEILVNEEPDLLWSSQVITNGPKRRIEQASDGTRYEVGRAHTEHWNRPVFGPWWGRTHRPAIRMDDTLLVAPAMWGDGAGHTGIANDAGRLVVEKDGKVITDQPATRAEVELPSGAGRYRVTVESTQDETRLSPRIRGSWDVHLAEGTTAKPAIPAMWAVRYLPEVTIDGDAAPGARMAMRLLTRAPAAPSEVETLTVDYSTDDGATWKAAETHLEDGHWWLELTNPDSGFVSLRSRLTDSAGNTAEQTIHRLWGISPGR